MNMKSWSAKNNSFFDTDQLERYVSAGWDLSDVTEIPDSLFYEYTVFPLGKCRVVVDGMPAWGDIPPPTHDEQIAFATAEKQSRIDEANEYMNSKQWPGKAAMGRLNDTERAQYNAWLDYLDLLEEVDTSTAPDIDWPVAPE
ncbi:tail fiber assembly protein [Yersinia aldovae]|uniref:tail fiber assembly protein n=1 Tax=Yersinia aldovae TaxID=29483 RepID=UPI0005AC30D3|nr:tail assembly chaperone [Yersinia aldovae]